MATLKVKNNGVWEEIPSIKGATGDQGIQGIQGLQGLKGDQGDQGIQGLKGDQGDQGIQGLQGLKGDKGDTGAQGLPGMDGADAVAGKLPSQYTELSAPIGTVSATLEDVPGMSVTIHLDEAVEIAINASFEMQTQSGSSSSVIEVAVNIDGVDHDPLKRFLSGSNDLGIGALVHRSEEVTAGDHIVKLRFRRVSGIATPGLNHAHMLVMGMQGAKGADGADGADGANGASTASEVAVVDTTNYWTGSNVESVLDQIGGEILIASEDAVGEPVFIKTLKNKAGSTIVPRTKVSAVSDDNSVSLATILSATDAALADLMAYTTITASSNVYTIDFANRSIKNVKIVTADSTAKTMALSNVPTQTELFIELMYTNAAAITWFNGITWLSGSAPVMETGKVYRIAMWTSNSGTAWQAVCVGGW